MPDYREIYNHVLAVNPLYERAENSPGLRAVIQASGRLSMLSGRSLDYGCGVGFAVEFLSGPTFDFNVHGVDISDQAIEQARTRLQRFPGSRQRLLALDGSLPFPNEHFVLVTCFDVLEHLDEGDIESALNEIHRVVQKGGQLMISVSCREAGSADQFGDNLHRTVRGVDWWLERFVPDQAEYDGHRQQLTMWKHQRLLKRNASPAAPAVRSQHPPKGTSSTGGNTLDFYRRVYDQDEWFGNAEVGRSTGVRLLPEYQEWLHSPVIDLGCGRGQVVETLRREGISAEGIDQVAVNPQMRVGDITQPIEGMDQFRSAVCIDCIEHLQDEQVLGLFANLRQVERQAFSIRNGDSNEVNLELPLNRKSFIDWTKLVREHLDIATAIPITDTQMLYLTQRKSEEATAQPT